MDPAAHDRLLAWTSHLPQAASTALALALAGAGIRPGDLGPGGRDMTRLAASSPSLWTGIALDNGGFLVEGLDGPGEGAGQAPGEPGTKGWEGRCMPSSPGVLAGAGELALWLACAGGDRGERSRMSRSPRSSRIAPGWMTTDHGDGPATD
jgi:hypothetical protein